MPSSPLPVLHTLRLCLRPLTEADGAAVYRMIDTSRASYVRWFGWAGESTPDSVRDYVRQAEEATSLGGAWHYVVLTQANSLIGRVSLTQIDPVNLSAELGYMLRTDFEGRGLMTESCRAVLGHAFGPGGLHRISAYADAENCASHQVLERMGFRREGTVRHAACHPERGWRDHCAFGLLEGELRG